MAQTRPLRPPGRCCGRSTTVLVKRLEERTLDGEEYLVMKEEDVLGVLSA